MARGEGRARVGTGRLEPFKDERVDYSRIENHCTTESPETGKYWREGFTDSVYVSGPISENVTKLQPFETGPTRPGTAKGARAVFHPEFRHRDNGIPRAPRAFSKTEAEYPRRVRR